MLFLCRLRRVDWSDVPEHARYKAAWIDGRHGPTRASLPPIEIEAIPDILHRLPRLHDDRPRASKPMLDAGGATARLRGARPGACRRYGSAFTFVALLIRPHLSLFVFS